MKRTTVIGLLASLALLSSLPIWSQEKPRIAVLQFENKAGVSWWSSGASAAQDVFVTELVKSGKFRVLDRERLDTLLSEQDLSLSGRIDASTAVAAGKVIGVKYFLVGALTEWTHDRQSASARKLGGLRGLRGKRNKFTAAMNARLIDAETGDILWADEAAADKSKYKISISGFGAGSDYSRNEISALVKPMVQELTAKLAASNF